MTSMSRLATGHGAFLFFPLLEQHIHPPTPYLQAPLTLRGITLGPGSGIVLAELIRADLAHTKPALSADISGLDPHRFAPKRAAKL